MSRMKTFRGKLAEGNQDKIHLAGGDESNGYRIKSFKIISDEPMAAAVEAVVKIYSISQASATAGVDFSDDTIIGVATYSETDSLNYPLTQIIIFDHEVFNQDIFVTYKSASSSSASMNYYLELEQIEMPKGEQAVVNFKAALLHSE